MKELRKIAWLIPIVQILLLVIIFVNFDIEDMTLTKGDIAKFNQGWTIVREDGTRGSIDALPYEEECEAGKTVIVENDIPEKYWGKTLSFLSADKTMKVYIDDKMIYEFGENDKRLFGHTPGSITNFIDIPEQLQNGHIRIEMVSPYDGYAAHISNMIIAKRDIAILNLVERNVINIICCITILFCGVIFAILSIIQKISHQRIEGMQYLSMISLLSCIYYFIETKTLSIFYGNQTIYSFLVFFILMILPMFLVLYYESNMPKKYNRLFLGLSFFIILNIVVQMVLQVTNFVDFMDMAILSHTLIFVSAIIVLGIFLICIIKDTRKELLLEFLALLFMVVGSLTDIIRGYLIKTGDLGKFSRYGMTVFCVTMVIEHIRRIAKSYSKSIEENAEYLAKEVERQTHVAEERGARIERLSYQLVMAFVTAIDAKDCYTNGHSFRVAKYSREIARRLGMTEHEQQDIYYIGLLHDVGKIGIPDEIINKPDKLTDEEYDIIKKHPQIGANILKNISEMPGIEIGAGMHHERYDGKGYPNGIAGEDIPLIARIIGVADAYDAMSSRRSYRDVLPQNVVRSEIVRGKGKQFDAGIADKMIEMIDQDKQYEMREK